MAKQLQRQYIFTPGTVGAGTIQIPGKWDLNQLLVITDITQNTVIYNFASTLYSGTTAVFTRGTNANFPNMTTMVDGYTTITLAYNTSGFSSTDVLQIFTERLETITRPWPMGTDAFERTRVAAPQSMIDADFEYGMQPTKWQTISQARGYPGIYEVPGTDLAVVQVTTDASYLQNNNPSVESYITVTTSYPHNLSTGTAVTINALQQTVPSYARAQGSFIVDNVSSSTIFSFYAKGLVGATSGTIINQQLSVIRKGGFYTGSSLTNVSFVVSGSGNLTTGTVTVTSTDPHGFVPGNSIVVIITSDNGSNNNTLCQGPFYINQVISANTFTYLARNVGNITGTLTGVIYPRSDSYYYHRPFDGGVQLGTGGPSQGTDAIRQSKKYLRYQSGKAVNYNTGALFAPNYNVRTVTSTGLTPGNIISIITDDDDHGCQVGAFVTLSGVNSPGYNGNYTVSAVIDERTINVIATGTMVTTTPVDLLSSPCLLSVSNWYGSTVRAGTYDDQNGIFWQYDGIQIAVGMRTSTWPIAGIVTATVGSHVIQGTNTRFTGQVSAGDRVTLKGMTHLVTAVPNDGTMYVTPEWRGSTSTSGAKMMKITDRIYPQSQWNMDRCDGSLGVFNPSGYNLNVNKMQMIGEQWTWYGAGFIDWMLRGPDGNYITVHRIKNSNVNTEAYMRSGNQPVRYQVINEGAHSPLVNAMGATDTVMTVTDVTYFPIYGASVYVDQEVINYTGVVTATNTLVGLTRGGGYTQFVAGQTRQFLGTTATTHIAGTGVILVGQTAAPQLSHWGSAYMSDGGFDDDKGYIFNYVATNIQVSQVPTTCFAVRLAPSVSNAIVGDLGIRDLINRAQMKLQALEVTAGGSSNVNCAMVVTGVLNPQNYPSNYAITWQTLGNTGLQTGQPSFAQIAQGQSITFDNTATTTYATSGVQSSGTNFLTLASTVNINVGDAVYIAADTGNRITGGTVVTGINPGINKITISNYLIGNIPTSTNITFSRTGFAQPGETVFSFVSSPSERDVLDLSLLKELTNTPLGARNCYPNGPDCLFINVYLTSGAPIYANLTLRWGEPQA
jgi:hypothetical protein